jgi:hypothetical protein
MVNFSDILDAPIVKSLSIPDHLAVKVWTNGLHTSVQAINKTIWELKN